MAHCFHVLTNLNGNHKHPELPSTVVDGMFVTWTEASSGKLRGCIGCLSEVPLSRLSEYAINAGLRDGRFRPITLHDMPTLSCTVSLLHSFTRCDHSTDWVVGVHGIIVEASLRGQILRATFLPHVIVEQGWTKSEALSEAIRKGGCNSVVPETSLSITRYEARPVTMSYREFCEYIRSSRSS